MGAPLGQPRNRFGASRPGGPDDDLRWQSAIRQRRPRRFDRCPLPDSVLLVGVEEPQSRSSWIPIPEPFGPHIRVVTPK
jgi:hypothetical protein